MELAQSMGTLRYSSVLADYRRYFMPKRPITVAVRGMHFGRYGRDSEDVRLVEMYLGYPELVRGYGRRSRSTRATATTATPVASARCYNNLRGSRVAVANIEVRAPLFGLFQGEIDYGRHTIEVARVLRRRRRVEQGEPARRSRAASARSFAASAPPSRVNALWFPRPRSLSIARPLDRAELMDLQWQLGIRQGF